MWFRKNQRDVNETSVSRDKLWEHLKSVEVENIKLKSDIQRIEQGFKALRAFVNKKYSLEPPEPEIEPEEPEIANPVVFNDGFDEVRKISKENVK